MIISYTQCSFMKSCPMKYKFRYVDGLQPKKKSSSLMRGKVVHEAFEKFFNGETKESILQFIHDAFNKVLGKATVEEEEEMLLSKYTTLGMVENYPLELSEFDEIIPEEAFTVRVPRMRGVEFTGRVDGLVKKKGLWWIREVKTTGNTQMQAETRARVSSQASGYVWGINARDHLNVQGLLYDFINKSRLKKRESDTATSFGERILEDYRAHMIDPKTGKELKTSRMYHRYYTYRSLTVLDEFVKDLEKIARRIRDAKREKDFMRNTDACYSYNTECPYLKICFLQHADSEMLNAFYERSEDGKERGEDSRSRRNWF